MTKKNRRQFAMVQRETIEFFAAYRYFKRANTNKTRTEDPNLFLQLTKLDDIGLRRPGMAELMVHTMLCSYRNSRTGMCWVSQATIAKKCRLSESTVSSAFKWLLKAKMIRKMDNVRVARKIVQGGKSLPVNLLTVFDLPFYGWADTIGEVIDYQEHRKELEKNGQQNLIGDQDGEADSLGEVSQEKEKRKRGRIYRAAQKRE